MQRISYFTWRSVGSFPVTQFDVGAQKSRAPICLACIGQHAGLHYDKCGGRRVGCRVRKS